jgi:FtsZ-interacting cell division protein ZipA
MIWEYVDTILGGVAIAILIAHLYWHSRNDQKGRLPEEVNVTIRHNGRDKDQDVQ